MVLPHGQEPVSGNFVPDISGPSAATSVTGNVGKTGIFSDGSNTVIGVRYNHWSLGDSLGDFSGLFLGPYELIRQLGVGGMAAVLLAKDSQLDRFVALKVLPPVSAKDQGLLDRFHQEARNGARLDHENIVRVYSWGEDQGLHFLALEYVEGDNLKTLIDLHGRLYFKEALLYLYQAARGLDHAALKGVVHRDIKPSNLLVTKDGKLKLVDMGLARCLGVPIEDGLTCVGATLGTFDYLSPEQALDPRLADARSDIYSLGCTFYHMLSGRPPVPEGSPAMKLAFHQSSQPIDLSNLGTYVPGILVTLLDKMVAKKPENRFAFPSVLVSEIELAAMSLGIQLQPSKGLSGVKAKPIKKRVIAVFVLIFLGIGLTYSWATKNLNFAHQTDHADSIRQPDSGHLGEAGKAAITEFAPVLSGTNQYATNSVARFDRPDASVRELMDWLTLVQGTEKIEIILHGDLDLGAASDRADSAIFVGAKNILIRSAHPGRRATLRYHCEGKALADSWAMLAIDAEIVRLEGLRFLIDARESPNPMHALQFRGLQLTAATIDRCEFLQAGCPLDDGRRIASIAVQCHRSAPSILIKDTAFLGFKEASVSEDLSPDKIRLFHGEYGGQDAILAKGYYREIRCENCLFGPHSCCFRLEGQVIVSDGGVRPGPEKTPDSSPNSPPVPGMMIPGMTMVPGMGSPIPSEQHFSIQGDGNLTIFNCSFLLGLQEKVVAIQELSSASVTLRRCLLGATPSSGKGGERIFLDFPLNSSKIRYTGRGNRYQGFTKFIDTGGGEQSNGIVEFQERLKTGGWGTDDESLDLSRMPWRGVSSIDFLRDIEIVISDKRASLGNLGANIVSAFQPYDFPELHWKEPFGEKFAGAESFGGAAFFQSVTDKKAVQTGRLIVIPGQNEPGKNIYSSIEKALEISKSGDVVLIRHSGSLPIGPLRIDKPGFEVTFKPDSGYWPLLEFEGTADQPALFCVERSLIILDGLEISIKQGRHGKRCSLVSLANHGSCHACDCLFTLVGHSVASAPVIGLVIPGSISRKVEGLFVALQPIRLSLERCFVKGIGSLIVNLEGKPLEVDVADSTISLAGDLVSLASSVDHATVQGAGISFGITRSRILIGGSGVVVRGAEERALPGWCMRSQNTQWISWNNDPCALIRIEGGLVRREKIKEWWGGGASQYFNWTRGLDVVDPDFAPRSLVSAEQWQEHLGEAGGEWAFVELPKVPNSDAWSCLTIDELPSIRDSYGFGVPSKPKKIPK